MAKVVRDNRQDVLDVDNELKKIEKKKTTKVKDDNKKDTKKATKKPLKKDSKKEIKKAPKSNFFKEVKAEFSKIKWPTKKDMLKYSIATIVFVVFFALFFYLIDLVMALLKAGV